MIQCFICVVLRLVMIPSPFKLLSRDGERIERKIKEDEFLTYTNAFANVIHSEGGGWGWSITVIVLYLCSILLTKTYVFLLFKWTNDHFFDKKDAMKRLYFVNPHVVVMRVVTHQRTRKIPCRFRPRRRHNIQISCSAPRNACFYEIFFFEYRFSQSEKQNSLKKFVFFYNSLFFKHEWLVFSIDLSVKIQYLIDH